MATSEYVSPKKDKNLKVIYFDEARKKLELKNRLGEEKEMHIRRLKAIENAQNIPSKLTLAKEQLELPEHEPIYPLYPMMKSEKLVDKWGNEVSHDCPDPTVCKFEVSPGKTILVVYGTEYFKNGKKINGQSMWSEDNGKTWNMYDESVIVKFPKWVDNHLNPAHIWSMKPIKVGDEYYMFYSVRVGLDEDGDPIYAISCARSKSPIGGFEDWSDKPIISGKISAHIDPDIIIEDGKYYMVWGSARLPIMKTEIVQDNKGHFKIVDPSNIEFILQPDPEIGEEVLEGAWIYEINGEKFLFYSVYDCFGHGRNPGLWPDPGQEGMKVNRFGAYDVRIAKLNEETGKYERRSDRMDPDINGLSRGFANAFFTGNFESKNPGNNSIVDEEVEPGTNILNEDTNALIDYWNGIRSEQGLPLILKPDPSEPIHWMYYHEMDRNSLYYSSPDIMQFHPGRFQNEEGIPGRPNRRPVRRIRFFFDTQGWPVIPGGVFQEEYMRNYEFS